METRTIEEFEKHRGRKLGPKAKEIVRDVINGNQVQFKDYFYPTYYKSGQSTWYTVQEALNFLGVRYTIIPGKLGGTWSEKIYPL